ncbi:MAG: hypothetical protein R2733_26785 [Acidimicrobiales bacterium]
MIRTALRWLNLARRLATVDSWVLALGDLDTLRSGDAPQRLLRPTDDQCYWADPFWAHPDGRNIVLCEEYDYRTRLGSIVALEIGPDGEVASKTTALETGDHLSYPFTFFDGEDWRCMPESSASGALSIYRLDSSLRLVDPQPITIEPDALDATMHEVDGLLLLFYTTASDPETLRIACAERIDGPWTEHPASGQYRGEVRSAGRFLSTGHTLLRPTQDGRQRYGGAVRLSVIDQLSPSCYRERLAEVIEPPPGWEGLHTLNRRNDGIVIVDLVRRVPVWRHRSFATWRMSELVRRVAEARRRSMKARTSEECR